MTTQRRQRPGIGRHAWAFAFAGCASMSAHGQERRVDFEEIIVTAQKVDQRIQDVPISIKAIDDETLATINADGLEDLTRLVPSLTMTNLSRGGNQVQIRGLGSNVASVGTVAIYNDGVISASRIQSSGTFAEQDSVIYDVERVEVLRGPQGTLYGEGSFGGVINIISKRPDDQEFQASFAGSSFDVDEGSSDNTDLQGMINIPLIKETLAVRAVGYKLDHDGYIDAVDVSPVVLTLIGAPGGPAVRVKEDANTEEVTGGRILATLRLGDGFDATAIYKTEKTELGITSTTSPHLIHLANTFGGTSFRPEFTQALFGPPFGEIAIGGETTVDEGILELNFQTPLGRLTSVTGVGEVDQDNANTLATDSESWSEEIRLTSDNDGQLNWIVGGYYRDAERKIVFSGFPFAEDALTQWSVFGQAYWEFAPRLTATLGLRYENQDSDVTDQINSLPTVSGDFDSEIPKLGIDFKLDDDTLLYASIAKGFRAGGANVDQSLGTDPDYVQAFDPDEIWSYEAGVKTSFLDRTLTINATVFYIDWTDIQIDRAIDALVPPGSTTQFIVVNGEDAHSFGIEADIYYQPTPDWDIVLGGSLLEAQFDGGTIDSDAASNVPIDGMTLPSTPEYLVNASVERRFDFDSGEIFLRGDYSLRGSSFGDVPNTPPVGLFGVGDLTSGTSRSLDLRAGVRFANWELQGFATNMTNELDSTFTFYDGGFGDLSVLLRPRTIGLNLKVHTD